MEKILIKNWQRIHDVDASVEGWVYKASMDGKIKVSNKGEIKTVADGMVGKVGDYLILTPEKHELKIVPKHEFEQKYRTE